MIILMTLLVLFTLLTAILLIVYLRRSDNIRLDRMGLQNLINDQEKEYYINEYKKILTAKFIYETMVEDRSKMDITRELIKKSRNIPSVQFFPNTPGVPEEITKLVKEEDNV
jgi:hypothetical protein